LLRNPGETSFRRQLLNLEPIGASQLSMDAAGNLLLAAEYQQSGTTDIVAYRGTVAAGLGTPTVVDNRGAAASLLLSRVGLNGHQAILWTQNNGTQTTTYAATASTPTETFAVSDMGILSNLVNQFLFVTDTGQVRYFDGNARRVDWSAASGWTAPTATPGLGNLSAAAANRRGDRLYVGTNWPGDWATYDAERNVMVQAFSNGSANAAYVLGVLTNAGFGTRALSISGAGFVSMQNNLDTLPTAAAPAGDGRPGVTNLWGALLK
jgi:hypothetical protein